MQYPRFLHPIHPLKWSLTAALVLGLAACGSNVVEAPLLCAVNGHNEVLSSRPKVKVQGYLGLTWGYVSSARVGRA